MIPVVSSFSLSTFKALEPAELPGDDELGDVLPDGGRDLLPP